MALLNETLMRGLAEMGSGFGAGAATILAALPRADAEGNPVPIWTARARAGLARAAAEAGSAVEDAGLSTATMVEAAQNRTPSRGTKRLPTGWRSSLRLGMWPRC